jgi:hypothetical protein
MSAGLLTSNTKHSMLLREALKKHLLKINK